MGKRIWQIIFAALMSVQTALAGPLDDYHDLQNLMAGVAALTPELAEADDTALLSEPAITAVMPVPQKTAVATTPTPGEPAQLQLIDLRIALVQLSIYAGTNDQLSVVRAQTTDAPKVIAIRNGAVSLAEIKEWIAAQPASDRILSVGGLRLPLVVLEGAQLTLSEGDVLHLSRADGAFLLNLGALIVDGARIAASGPVNQNVPDYAPFVVTAGSGMAQIKNAHITGLGFGKTAAFSGLAVVNKGLYQPIGQSFLISNVLRDIGAVTLLGADDPVVQGNVVLGGRNAGLVLNHTTRAIVRGNLITRTDGGSALRITDQAQGSLIANNLIYNNANTGIQIARGSYDTRARDNMLWRNGGVGLSINRADCTHAARNVAMDNAKKGIEVQSSWHASVIENRIFGNGSAGLLVTNQPNGTETLVTSNVFAGNRIGLASASAHVLTLRENDFSSQLPRLVEGDLLHEAHQIMTDLTGTAEIQFVAGGIEVFSDHAASCRSEKEG